MSSLTMDDMMAVLANREARIKELKEDLAQAAADAGSIIKLEVKVALMKMYIEALEKCSDQAEVYHELQGKGIEMAELKKGAGL